MNWTIPPSVFADVAGQDFERKYRQFIITIYNNLVVLSPVDTGRYKGNHHISFGTPSFAVDVGVGLQLPPQGTFPVVYLQNNLPYAKALENGHSKQAPTGVYTNAFNSAIASFV